MVPLKPESLTLSATVRDAVLAIEQSRRGIATVTDVDHDVSAKESILRPILLFAQKLSDGALVTVQLKGDSTIFACAHVCVVTTG